MTVLHRDYMREMFHETRFTLTSNAIEHRKYRIELTVFNRFYLLHDIIGMAILKST